ncbi:TonB-dependent receptor [Asticcacaulis endophyticus]|uniref:TonB-dependent receptor n=1 Tax=Asticcacaulis endophyticus TaxID=1395890 RepID=A0A918Q6Y4_9CAUL|nr:TonB-dependent receptor [Asticcacaulis endophyticus]GGZ35443.1 TonB-dependent receptor [Asticcacaulis endophyticus]
MTFKHYALVSTALTGLLMASVATAQDQTAATTSADAPVEEVVIVGFRKSLADALRAKKDDIRVSDGISAEDIGKFPSENIAEAIQRIPGVQIGNVNGRGSTIAVRGLGPQYAYTTVNGQTFKSANFTDGFRFDVIQTELASGIQVIKSPTADMDAGGLAGTINIDTVRPLNLKGRTLVASVKAQNSELADADTTPKVTLTYGDKFLDGKLGVFLGAGYQKLNDRADYSFMDRWYTTTASNTFAAGSVAVPAGTVVPRRPRYRRIDRETERSQLNAAVQYRPSEDLEMGLTAIYSHDYTTYDVNQQVFLFGGLGTIQVNEVTNGLATKIVVNNFTTENNRQLETRDLKSSALTADFKYTGIENLTLKGVINYTEGKGYISEEAAILAITIPSATLDMSDPENVKFSTSVDLNDTASYAYNKLTRNEYPNGGQTRNDTDETSAQLDAKYWLDMGWLQSASVGLKYKKENFNRHRTRRDRLVLGYYPTAQFTPAFSYNDAVSGFLDGEGSFGTNWVVPDIDGYREMMAAEGVTIPLQFAPEATYGLERDIKSVYTMTDLKGDLFGFGVRGNVGIRVEKTDQTVNGYLTTPNPNSSADVRIAAGTYSTDKSYTNVLPSANFVVNLNPNLLVRASAAKVLVRPILDSSTSLATTINSSVSGGVTTYSIALGEADLEPLTANQGDLGIEWYYGKGNALSLSAFAKEVKNGTFDTFICPASFEGVALTDNGTDCVSANGSIYDINIKANDPSKNMIKGYEVNWQQSLDNLLPLDGFGVIANYTHVTQDKSAKFQLRNLSENTANLTGYWENSTFSARVSANYRSEYLQNSADSFFARETHIVKDRTQVDVVLGYTINEQMSLSFGAQNITNEKEDAYYLTDNIWQMTAVTGPSYYLSFQYKM